MEKSLVIHATGEVTEVNLKTFLLPFDIGDENRTTIQKQLQCTSLREYISRVRDMKVQLFAKEHSVGSRNRLATMMTGEVLYGDVILLCLGNDIVGRRYVSFQYDLHTRRVCRLLRAVNKELGSLTNKHESEANELLHEILYGDCEMTKLLKALAKLGEC